MMFGLSHTNVFLLSTFLSSRISLEEVRRGAATERLSFALDFEVSCIQGFWMIFCHHAIVHWFFVTKNRSSSNAVLWRSKRRMWTMIFTSGCVVLGNDAKFRQSKQWTTRFELPSSPDTCRMKWTERNNAFKLHATTMLQNYGFHRILYAFPCTFRNQSSGGECCTMLTIQGLKTELEPEKHHFMHIHSHD